MSGENKKGSSPSGVTAYQGKKRKTPEIDLISGVFVYLQLVQTQKPEEYDNWTGANSGAFLSIKKAPDLYIFQV